MYNHFFGFKERPFKLVPDPDYLFLSRSHEEALAHLKYAVLSGEGFVEIIGEVGTGKTMLCRTFLESMGPDVETAYIFNPKMDARELLMAVNQEFGIASDHGTIKALIDELNQFLMEKKRQGQKAILLIDEAQNLGRTVLEQIRLLTNLETAKDKLLQIILVGQPELGELLDSYELRQLGQRITLSCRLRPLTLKETMAYINHRLHVAACKQTRLFTNAAIRKIHRYARGVPRLINIAGDRSLLSAYGENRGRVTGRIADTAIRELTTRGDTRRSENRIGRKRLAAFSAAAVFFVALILYQSDIKAFFGYLDTERGGPTTEQAEVPAAIRSKAETSPSASPGEGNPEKKTPAILRHTNTANQEVPAADGSTDTKTTEAPSAESTVENLAELLKSQAEKDSRRQAVETLLAKWRGEPLFSDEFQRISEDDVFIELSSRLNGLYAHRIDGDLSLIHKLNLPAILEMDAPDQDAPVFLPVTGAAEKTLTFPVSGAEAGLTVPYEDVLTHWNGVAYVLWENFYHYRGIIPLNSTGDSVITLKMHLRDMGFTDLSINAAYDEQTRSAVRAVQARHGIPVDGYVGPLTKMILYNEKEGLKIPHLEEEPELKS